MGGNWYLTIFLSKTICSDLPTYLVYFSPTRLSSNFNKDRIRLQAFKEKYAELNQLLSKLSDKFDKKLAETDLDSRQKSAYISIPLMKSSMYQ